MAEFLALQWPCQALVRAGAQDDVFALGKTAGVAVVADGETRSGYAGRYPNPSLTHAAAETVAVSLARSLAHYGPSKLNSAKVHGSFAAANDAVARLNRDLDLADRCNWWDQDLAGAVAAAVAVGNSTFWYGYIGDCGIAHLSSRGAIRWHTPDMIAPVARLFPPVEPDREREQRIRMRQHFRNQQSARHPTYGVLTGEEGSLPHVFAGYREYREDDALVVYSNGMASFVLEDATFQHLLVNALPGTLREYVIQCSTPTKNPDEKTVVIIRT